MTKPVFEKTKNQENMGKEQLMSTVDSLEVKLRENLEPLENLHKYTELYIRLYLKRSMQLEKIIRFRINPGGKTLNLFSGGKVDKKRKK